MPLGGNDTPCLRCYPGVSSPGLVGPTGYEPAIIQRRGRWISPMCGGNPRTRRALLVRQYRLFQASRSAAYWLPKERDYCCFLTTLPFGWRSMTYPRGSNPHHAIKPLRRVTAIWLLTRLRQPELVGPAEVEPASAGFLCSRAQTVRPMKCPSVRAAKRLSALSHNGRRVSPSQGGTDNRHVDQTRRGGAGGCRTRTFAALAQPRAFRRRSFPDELPAPCSTHSTPLARCGLRPYASLSPLKGDDLHVPAEHRLRAAQGV